MALQTKIKIALDETRLLILGASILLGFQLHAPFYDGFSAVPRISRLLDEAALLLLVFAVGALVTPACYHRLTERGTESQYLLHVTSRLIFVALIPFGLGIGLVVFIAIERLAGSVLGATAGGTSFVLAVWFWYGLGYMRGAGRGKGRAVADQRQTPKLETQIDQMLTEARVLLPGAQALLGFQLAIVLTRAFDDVAAPSKAIHGIALGAICLTIILLMAPAAYHRLAHDGENTIDTLRVGSRLVTVATFPLAVGIVGDVYVVITQISHSETVGIVAALFAGALLTGLWLAFPLAARRRPRRPATLAS